MSDNKRKNGSQRPGEAVGENQEAARVVAIPKEGEAASQPPNKGKAKSERIGDILRAARLERDDDLYQIAEYLCIKPAFLIALENSRYDEFPADAYIIGFLRTYANFLGVDGKDAVDRYRYEMAGRRRKPVLAMPVPMSEGRAPSILILAGASVAALLIYALWYGISSANRTDVNAPPPLPVSQQVSPADNAAAAGLTAPMNVPAPQAQIPAPVSSNSANVPASAIPPAAPGIMLSGDLPPPLAPAKDGANDPDAMPLGSAPAVASAKEEKEKGKETAKEKESKAAKSDTKDAPKDGKQVYGDASSTSRLLIKASQSSWVMVTDSAGKTVFDQVLKPGDAYKVPNKPGLKLTTGNGAGISLTLDGTELPKVASGAPHVVRDIPLDPDKLMEPQ